MKNPMRLVRLSWSVAYVTGAAWVVAVVCPISVASERDDAVVPAEGAAKMSETWSRIVPIKAPTPDEKIGQWRAWVEEGWLVVERRTDDDKVEWKIVLAKVMGDAPPEIIADDFDAIQINYRDGHYFIRDYSTSDADGQIGCLRCRRQPKSREASWPGFPVPPYERGAPGSFGGGRDWSLLGAVSEGWYTITAGPNMKGEQPFADCSVRICHIDLGVPAFGGGGGGGGVLRDFYGKWFVEDDGELLVANRLEARDLADELESAAKDDPALAGRLAAKKLVGSPAPELSGEVWLNADEPPTWKSLRGKPVLLVLFDLKQASFLPLVPPLLAFQEMYDKQGLAVLGVHAKGPSDDVKKRLADESITFPVLIDDGKTAKQYGTGFSACVLIDREGKVLSVYKGSLAPPAEIEKLLEEMVDDTRRQEREGSDGANVYD
jgi:hypothetical protein